MMFKRKIANPSHLISALVLLSGCGRNNFTNTEPTGFDEDVLASIQSTDRHDKLVSDLLRLTPIPSPTAGIQQLGRAYAPVILPPEINNSVVFFQISRCSEETVGEMESVRHHEATSAHSKYNAEIESPNGWSWNDIKFKCQIVTDLHPQMPFVDITAPTGRWFWFFRACATRSLTHELACNSQLLRTRNSIDFRNQRAAHLTMLVEAVEARTQKINQLTSKIQQQTLALGLAFEQCDLALWKKAENIIKRSIIANIIGYGAALLIEIYSKEILNAPKNGDNWTDKFTSLWKNESSDQKAIVRTLLWLFTSNDDFSVTCMPAEQIKSQAMENLLHLKEQQILLAREMDTLEAEGIPISQVILK